MTEAELKQQVEAARTNLAKGTMRLGGNPSYAPSPAPVVTEPDEPHAGVPAPRRVIVNSQPLPDMKAKDFPAHDDVITWLLDGPEAICDKQEAFDQADRVYKSHLTELTIKAYNTPLFTGKKGAEGLVPASNDPEREAAIDSLCSTDPRMLPLAITRETALRELMREKSRFEAAKLIAALLTAAIR